MKTVRGQLGARERIRVGAKDELGGKHCLKRKVLSLDFKLMRGQGK